jgi:uncharacterized protein
MERIELEIVALSHSITQTHSYAVVLGELNGLRRLPIVIGGFEAQAIAVALEKMQPSRPLTHDLFANFMNTFGIELREVVIYKLDEGIFYSKLVCEHDAVTVEIDSRTSDALALAIRANCKIYTFENILDAAGLFIEQQDEAAQPPSRKSPQGNKPAAAATAPNKNSSDDNDLKKMNLTELNKLLKDVLETEDYVRAISIRDEINRRK